MGLGGVAIAVLPYVIHPKTAVLGRAGGGISTRPSAHLVRTKQSLLNVGTSINKDYFRRVHWMSVFK